MIRIVVFSVLTLLAAGAAGAENQPSIPCKIKGFKTFCKYWDSCTKAPANSVTSNGRCLYSRMGTLNPDASLRDQNMSGSYSKVTFVSGPDTVAKLAEWHCTPGSRVPQPLCPRPNLSPIPNPNPSPNPNPNPNASLTATVNPNPDLLTLL